MITAAFLLSSILIGAVTDGSPAEPRVGTASAQPEVRNVESPQDAISPATSVQAANPGPADINPSSAFAFDKRFWHEAAYPIMACQVVLALVLILARFVAGPPESDSSTKVDGSSLAEPALGDGRESSMFRQGALFVLELGKYLIFPVFLLGSILAAGGNSGAFIVLSALALSVVLEYAIPYKAEWNKLGRQELNDVLHLFFSAIPGDAITKMLAYSMVPVIAVMVATPGNGIWPTNLYFPLQVILAVILFEAVIYPTHLLSHHWLWFWNFHRLHHTSQRITVSKGFRRNIQEAMLESGVSLIVVLLFGVPADVLQWLVGFQVAGTIFAHANVVMYLPPYFDRIFVTPAAHRIHHSVELRYSNSNYGNTLMIFDVIFGTFTDPNKHTLGDMGVRHNSVPVGFFKQWLLPFYWHRLDKNPVKQDGWK